MTLLSAMLWAEDGLSWHGYSTTHFREDRAWTSAIDQTAAAYNIGIFPDSVAIVVLDDICCPGQCELRLKAHSGRQGRLSALADRDREGAERLRKINRAQPLVPLDSVDATYRKQHSTLSHSVNDGQRYLQFSEPSSPPCRLSRRVLAS